MAAFGEKFSDTAAKAVNDPPDLNKAHIPAAYGISEQNSTAKIAIY